MTADLAVHVTNFQHDDMGVGEDHIRRRRERP